MKVTQITVLVAALAFTACQPAGPAGLSEADRAAIAEVSKTFLDAARASDWQTVAGTYTENAILMPPNAPIVEGRANIQTFFEGFPPLTDFNLENVEVEGSGDFAYVRGTYSMTITLPGMDPMPDTGKYIEIRQKQADGSWLLHRDIFSSDLEAGH